jgi:hypothetical protein
MSQHFEDVSFKCDDSVSTCNLYSALCKHIRTYAKYNFRFKWDKNMSVGGYTLSADERTITKLANNWGCALVSDVSMPVTQSICYFQLMVHQDKE